MKGHLVNKKQSQSGSGHLIVIIILVLALLGVLGYISYDKFIANKPVDSKNTLVTDDWTKVTLANNNLTFKLPSDWGDCVPFGDSALFSALTECRSSDYKSDNFDDVNEGNVIWVQTYTHNTPDISLETLCQITDGCGENGSDIKVSDVSAKIYNSVLREYSSRTILFKKGGYIYSIQQEYNTKSGNPYPNLLDGIISTTNFIK